MIFEDSPFDQALKAVVEARSSDLASAVRVVVEMYAAAQEHAVNARSALEIEMLCVHAEMADLPIGSQAAQALRRVRNRIRDTVRTERERAGMPESNLFPKKGSPEDEP